MSQRENVADRASLTEVETESEPTQTQLIVIEHLTVQYMHARHLL